jgi:hypothetical protein
MVSRGWLGRRSTIWGRRDEDGGKNMSKKIKAIK